VTEYFDTPERMEEAEKWLCAFYDKQGKPNVSKPEA
jgi:hypothetical protein